MGAFKLFLFNKFNILILFLGIVFLSISVYKASHTAFTHDESFTYLSYVKKSVIGIVRMEEPVSANNHILNSLSMKVIDKLMPPTPFNLRLPNIFGHLLFLFFSALFVNNFKNNYFKVFGFVLLNANIYLIDIFSLARGYGLSLGFLMMHWYFLSNTLRNRDNKNNVRLMLFALFLAMLSSFSIIYYALSIILIYIIFEIKNGIQNNNNFLSLITNNLKTFAVFAILSAGFLFEPMLKLINFKQLYFGGTNNFFDDTIYSLVFYSSNAVNLSDDQINFIYVLTLLLLASTTIIQTFRLLKNGTTIYSGLFISLFVMIMIIQIAFFYLFNTKYLIQRTALFLTPLFVIALLGVLDELGYTLIYFFSGFVAIFLFYITLRYTPLTKSLNWGYDADNESLISDLKSIHNKSNNKEKLSLGVDWIFQPSLNYYRATTEAGLWLDTIIKEGYDNKKFEYFFVESQSLSKFVDTNQFKVLKTYHQSNNSLIKNLKFE